MASTVQKLTEKQLVRPPAYLPANVQYETITGSTSYGVSEDDSDMDIVGFCIPTKHLVFPHLAGHIPGFGKQIQRFDCWQEHRVVDKDALRGRGRTYDLNIYNIVRYFHLCMENNPNMVDSLFTAADCVLHCTAVGVMVREKRKIFLHKGAWPKFKGYAYSQLHKMKDKNPEGKRKELVDRFGYDVKYAYHLIRLLDEVEQIMVEGDIDLRRNREQLKAIRKGEVPEADLIAIATEKERQLEQVYLDSKLRHGPDQPAIKQLLIDCLEQHYGNLEDAVVNNEKAMLALQEIQTIVGKFV